MLSCNHLYKDVKKMLGHFEAKDKRSFEILFHIFGSECNCLDSLIGSRSHVQNKTRLDHLLEEWETIARKKNPNDNNTFAAYFEKHKARQIHESVIRPNLNFTPALDVENYFTTNDVESIKNAIKTIKI